MATKEEALDDLKASVATLPIRVRIEVYRRVLTAITERDRDQREQQIQTTVDAAKALPSYAALDGDDLDKYLRTLQSVIS